jgi:S-adenosylmethionine decarboxylase
MNALARLGMVSESPSENQTMSTVSAEPQKDYYVEKDGVKYAGMHLIIDLWGASNLDSPDLIDETLCNGALAAGATILHHHFHHFTPNGGVSGVVVLAESHISIHSWPERNFAALDVFMCGSCDPYKLIPFLKAAFTPAHIQISELKRGLIA